jgi:hypothetical protein
LGEKPPSVAVAVEFMVMEDQLFKMVVQVVLVEVLDMLQLQEQATSQQALQEQLVVLLEVTTP